MTARSTAAAVVIGAGHLAAFWIAFAGGEPLFFSLSRLAVGVTFLGAGLVSLRRRPDNPLGRLLVVVAALRSLDGLVWSDWPPAGIAGIVLADAWLVVFVYVALAYPSGRLTTRRDVLIVAATVVLCGPLAVLGSLAWDPAFHPSDVTQPDNPMNVWHDHTLSHWLTYPSWGIGLLISLACAMRCLQRWRAATPVARRMLGPVLYAAQAVALVVAGLMLALLGGHDPFLLGRLASVVYATVAVAFLVAMTRSRIGRAAVGDLVLELGGETSLERLRGSLAQVLHDPDLVIGYWVPEQDRYVDARGGAVTLPGNDGAQVVTLLQQDGDPLAALIHDPALRHDPEVLEAASAAALLAIHNHRLQVELKEQLVEIRASRKRLVSAGDEARRKLERDLHDGAQQRLVTSTMSLRLALARLQAGQSTEAEGLLGEASGDLEAAIDELRELARGLHPGVLTQHGLGAALVSLADRLPLPVRLIDVVQDRLPAQVEGAAYFVVSEALTNALKHAQASEVTVRVTRQNGSAIVEIQDDGRGGADVHRGSGLRGLADRVSALDGTLTVRSPLGKGTQIKAELPCPS